MPSPMSRFPLLVLLAWVTVGALSGAEVRLVGSDLARPAQGAHRGSRAVGQQVGRMELADMPGSIDAKAGGNEPCNPLQFLVGVVQAGDDQGGQFDPDPQPAVLEDRVEHL